MTTFDRHPRAAHVRDSWLTHREHCGECRHGTNLSPPQFCEIGRRLFNACLAIIDPPRKEVR